MTRQLYLAGGILAIAAMALAPPAAAQSAQGAANGQGHKPKHSQVPDVGRDDAPSAPSAADAALERMLSQPTEGLRTINYADGTVTVDLDGTHMSVAIATRGQDDTVKFTCTDDIRRALTLLQPALLTPTRLLGTAAELRTVAPPAASGSWEEKE
jgi:hypothetical protein